MLLLKSNITIFVDFVMFLLYTVNRMNKGRMRLNTRQQDIVILAEKRGEITIKELAEIFSVSEMTIHRDLLHLEKLGYLYKKRGAAVYTEKEKASISAFYGDEKRRIGKAAASLVKEGQSILFDNSTTALECARFLSDVPNLTFYTTNLEIASELSKNKRSILYCSGGFYSQDSHGFLGSGAEAFVSSLSVDIAFIGASGISEERGVTIPYPAHTSLQKAIIKAAKTCILLADHSKFGKIAAEKVADLSQIHRVVTDDGIKPEIADRYRSFFELTII